MCIYIYIYIYICMAERAEYGNYAPRCRLRACTQDLTGMSARRIEIPESGSGA